MGEEGISISDQGKQVKVDVFEDADLLSDEEKAAMADDDGSDPDATEADDKAAADDAAAKAQEDADAEKEAEIQRANEAIAKEKDAQAKDAGGEGDKNKAGEAGAEDGVKGDADTDKAILVSQTPPPVTMDAMSPEEVTQVKDALGDAKTRFQNGEIDYDQYFDERLELERKLWANDIAVQLSTDGVENQWKWEQQSFLTDPANEWINGDDVVYSAFAATVNRIMSTEEGATMPGPELLAQAREEVANRFSPTLADDTATAAEKKAAAEALKGAKKTQADKALPDTLAGTSTAEIDGGVGEFDYLDKLDGDAYERAVESLSEAQLARYESIQ